ncbi:MAG: hypothetical protein QW292_08535 [Candidatus Parvarchaeota archaeon]
MKDAFTGTEGKDPGNEEPGDEHKSHLQKDENIVTDHTKIPEGIFPKTI